MKVQTLIKKLFGKNSIQDYMDTLDSDDRENVLEYYSIETTEDASEPDYFLQVKTNGVITVCNINSKVLISTTSEKELKEKLKVLAESAE